MSKENINNLVELFFIKYKEQKKDNILLTSLKDTDNNFTWEKTFHSTKFLILFKFIKFWWAKRESNSHSIATIGF